MQFGLSDQTVEKINTVFAKHPAIERVVLYGSRAKGTQKPGSDIDLTIYGKDIPQEEYYHIFDELDALDLPYSIDLSLFSQLKHIPLRNHIERVGVVFYARHLDGCVGCHAT